ncbi:hypothetical protein CHGG_07160 [Chaetomium globosum CBS 148.51]|uniref:Elongator complex protein 2 n=1 Tax=Chaetomium globosum (strain ATCC 6205 / CBS 148.51 / DSM 1962 / NBRC 6347 / NRRL 1970) TaxID=306901 RepID=Q2GXZ4_CHAGB|nr:uncharacterized protein CHGG_07160 [Chaetomium globosum CBS 148.51]EAQ85907.1 hypothetical protein CHGG_07160 [Chaetomium globosum CBS 148.51]
MEIWKEGSGANRYTAAADWAEDGLVAFGSDSNVCLWDPTDPKGISNILSGHTAHVRAVAFLPGRNEESKTVNLVTGGDDKQLRLWAIDSETGAASCVQTIQEHSEPINCIAALKSPASGDVAKQIFATGAADATVKIWVFEAGQITLLQTIKTTRKYMPLTLALSALEEGNGLVLAVAGTTNAVQIFTASAADGNPGVEFTLQATLPGHENWIRSLDFIREKPEKGSDILLASASQDKYIRLWLFEALLLGHEDWVYSARWFRAADGRLQLLSASADNTLSLWESDTESGIWLTVVRLGEISREKGATTATGSIGGFWTGLWSPSGTTVITLGRTGSWRRWDYDAAEDMWKQNFAISGHTRAVTGISWSRDGLYLLSTSSDQTTRLHAEWALDARNSWHEMSRPQIHGYDLNCISALGPASFVSGADEKLMRVFTEPKAVARMLSHLTNTAAPTPETEEALPDVANMPVLGLSNKAVTTLSPEEGRPPAADSSTNQAIDPTTADPDTATTHAQPSPLSTLTHPPLEESLSRHTLWPEIEKLYGHGYEISCLAANHDGTLVASACRASSLTHAVIRLFETRGWTELRPPLQAHTLTVARVRFSRDDRYILSVGRDRGWAVWERTQASEGQNEGERDGGYKLAQTNAKGHTRMVLDAAWAPVGDDANGTRVFATAGRDKLVKVWVRKGGEGGQFELGKAVTEEHPVTALDFVPEVTEAGLLLLAVGTEGGKVSVLTLKVNDGEVEVVSTSVVGQALSLPKAVLQLAWRPTREGRKGEELAIAGEDGSLRIYSFLAL